MSWFLSISKNVFITRYFRGHTDYSEYQTTIVLFLSEWIIEQTGIDKILMRSARTYNNIGK